MALAAGTIWELNAGATANNVNSGGFNPANANMLTDGAATSATGNSPVFSSASYNFVAGDVGHWVYVKAGTNWTPGWYQIASVASNNATLKAAIGEAVQTNTTVGIPSPRYLANTVAGVATTASPTGATFTVDYSQSTASPFTATDLASTDGTTTPSTITSATAPFGKNMVGNLIQVRAGTSWTQGWYEIVSVTTVTATLDRAVGSSATLTLGTFNVGGAMSLNSSTASRTDDDLMEKAIAGNRFFVKNNGTFTVATAMSITAAGSAALPIDIEGYNTLRGDTPTGTSRPTIAGGSNGTTLGTKWHIYNIIITGSGTNVLLIGADGKAYNCKSSNNSTTAARQALTIGSNAAVIKCEGISYRGRAGYGNNSNGMFAYCYFHDSDKGFFEDNTATRQYFIGNIMESNVTAAIHYSAAHVNLKVLLQNTLYGSENTTGTGLLMATGNTTAILMNNVITGFATGVSHADVQVQGFDDFNNYQNNDTDITNWQKGANDVAIAPAFTNVGQVTGTAGAFTAGNDRLVDTTKNFDSLGVVAGQDFIYIVSGTGVTAGQYKISSLATTTNPNDTLVLDLAPGTSTVADKVYQITIGRNFLITGAL